MNENDNKHLKDYSKARNVFRVLGWIFLPIGIILTIIGIASMFNFEMGNNLFFFTFIGMPFDFLGMVFLILGYMGKVNSYTASQNAPVAKDVTNYMLDGTREEVGKTAKTIHDSIKDEKGVVCPKCNTLNEPGAKFCDHCGAPLTKTCTSCGEINDADSTFCRKCGKKL